MLFARCPRFVSCAILLAASTGAAAAQARPTSMPIQDPTIGVIRGQMLLPPGWHGTAHVDRTTDSMANGSATVAADLSSADGKSRIVMVQVPFRTYGMSRQVGLGMPGNPTAQVNVAFTRFNGTADLLTRYIIPALGLAGKIGPVQSISREQREAKRQQMLQQGGGQPIYDVASTTITSGNLETTIFAGTSGGVVPPAGEYTITLITLSTGPIGQTEKNLGTFFALGQPGPTAAWQQADNRYVQMKIQQMNEETQRLGRQYARENEQIIATGQANVAAIQRAGEIRHNNWLQQQQRNTDAGANFRGYLSNSDTSFKWCSASDITYTVNSTVSPGSNYRRCD